MISVNTYSCVYDWQACKAKEIIHSHIQQNIDKLRSTQDEHNFSALKLIVDAPAEDGHFPTDQEIREAAAELLTAGHETLASSLTSMVALLGQNPKVVQKARVLLRNAGLLDEGLDDSNILTLSQIEGVQCINNIIEETFRKLSPVGGFFRKVLSTIELEASILHILY